MPANSDVAAAFHELADLLELQGAERFRILTYRRAAEELEELSKDLSTMSEKDLTALRGVGKAIAGKITEFLQTGSFGALEEARLAVPDGLRQMTRLAGLGPKKVMLMHRELGISSIEDLQAALDQGSLRAAPGMGPKSEENLRRALETYSSSGARVQLDVALDLAEQLTSLLSRLPTVEKAGYAGSLRRMRETIGDVDLLVGSADPASVMQAFVTSPHAHQVLARGATKSTIVTSKGLQVDLRVVDPDEYGAAMQYFTGSKHHNVRVREHAVKLGMKLSEYGLFRGDVRVASRTEEDIYAALGMQTPLPTMREDKGEVQLALKGELPSVVALEDLRGDLHSHSDYSDGTRKLQEMASAAANRGYEYFAVTDHARNIHVRSLSIEDIERQAAEVAEFNSQFGEGFTLLHGVEINIGPRGDVDYPDDIMAGFDVVVASVHQGMEMDRVELTDRILKVLEHPSVNILGHPTGRRIGRRPPMDFDLDAVFRAAAANRVALEINSNPMRLDLKDDHLRRAKEHGCLFAIDSDSHQPSRLDRIRLGVGTAQRAWVTADEVINTWPLPKLRSFLAKQRP